MEIYSRSWRQISIYKAVEGDLSLYWNWQRDTGPAPVPNRALDFAPMRSPLMVNILFTMISRILYLVLRIMSKFDSATLRVMATDSCQLRCTPRPSITHPALPHQLIFASTSTSITVGWNKPTVNGGQVVSGYELWMDPWGGGGTFMVTRVLVAPMLWNFV